MSMKDCFLRQARPEVDSYAEEFGLFLRAIGGQLDDLKMGCHTIHFVFLERSLWLQFEELVD